MKPHTTLPRTLGSLRLRPGLLGSQRMGRSVRHLYELVDAQKTKGRTVVEVCVQLGVSRSGYYGWATHKPSRREREDAELADRIEVIHRESLGEYGAPRIHA